jgi:hypothetical protein
MARPNTMEASAMPVTAVNVLNNNDFPLEDRYNGVPGTFVRSWSSTMM